MTARQFDERGAKPVLGYSPPSLVRFRRDSVRTYYSSCRFRVCVAARAHAPSCAMREVPVTMAN